MRQATRFGTMGRAGRPGAVAAALWAAAVLAACGGGGGGDDPGSGPGDVPADGIESDVPVADGTGQPDVRPAFCTNGVLDPDESDKDCGGPCRGCERDQACRGNEDCATEWCAAGKCNVSTCLDGLKGPGETDIDCGGNCAPCAGGKACSLMTDCVSGMCVLGVCVNPNCEDQRLNGNESDIDCGGAQCPDCANGATCREHGDCLSGRCAGVTCMACAEPKDCPGLDQACSVRTCTAGVCGTRLLDDGEVAATQVPGDCRKTVCDGNGGQRQDVDDTDKPDDGKDCTVEGCQDGTRTDAFAEEGAPCDDAGGRMCDAAGGCLQCKVDADCATDVCLATGKCGPATCKDNHKNGTETDTDCGGTICPPCGDGKVCNADRECTSGACVSFVCAPPTCEDDRKNGAETAVDCGGGTCPGCALYDPCGKDVDCLSGHCLYQQCVQCVLAADCPGTDGDCRLRTCDGQACGETLAGFGTPAGTQVAGDCKKAICDGEGAIVKLILDSDVPDDGLDCTEDLCTDGVPGHVNRPLDYPCDDNGGVKCDGNGACIAPPA